MRNYKVVWSHKDHKGKRREESDIITHERAWRAAQEVCNRYESDVDDFRIEAIYRDDWDRWSQVEVDE